jgi:solute:Na+ symporter, SSS family
MQAVTIITFIFFTGMVGFITWRMTRRDDHGTSEGYFLAGRTLTGGFIAGSLMLTNLSTEQLVGLNGAAFTDGFSVMAWEVIAAMSLVVMGLFFLPRYLKSGIATIPEFLALRYDHNTRAITNIIFIFAYTAILLPIILYTGATGLNGILDMQSLTGIASETGTLWLTVWLVGIIGSLYAIFGGLRTVAVSDTINGVGLLVGGVLITYFGLSTLGGEGGFFEGLATLKAEHPEKLNSIGGDGQQVPFSTLFTGVLLLNLFYWCTNQQIIQRTFGASSLKEGQKGVLLAGYFKVLAPFILVLPGVIAFHLYADDGIKADHAYGTLVKNVLPAPLAGFFAAVLVGAILSSFNSALNSTCTLFSLGVYKNWVKPDASQEQIIKSGKIFGIAIALFAMCIAPALAGQESIFGYLQQMNGLYFIPIFAVVVVGIANKRVPAFAANVALILGFAAIAGGYWMPGFKDIVGKIHGFHYLGLVFAILVALLLIIGTLRPREEAWVQADARAVDLTPWKYAKPVGAVLVLLVLTFYAVLADFSVL